MNKTTVILICIIIALISGIIGYAIGVNVTKTAPAVAENPAPIQEQTPEEKCVGTYFCTTWNGSRATLVLNKDMTMKYPSNKDGKWSVEGTTIHLDIDPQPLSKEMKEFMIQTNQYDEEKIKQPTRIEATKVDNGIIINDNFFQKMN